MNLSNIVELYNNILLLQLYFYIHHSQISLFL